MTRSEQYKEWEIRLKDYRSSGQKLADYCANHQLKADQVRYWLRKQKRTKQPIANTIAQWLAVEIEGTKTECIGLPLLIKIGSAIIEVHPGFNAELLLDVVRTLNTTC